MATSKRAAVTPVCVFARIKPMAAEPEGGHSGVAVPQHVESFDAETVTMAGIPIRGKRTFSFHSTLGPEATQPEVYERTVMPLVAQWLDGYDVDVLLHGQTGSGKTYTAFGPPGSTAAAAARVRQGETDPSALLRAEHGLFLRAGFEAVAAVAAMNAAGEAVALHGSMVEVSIASCTHQSAVDLLRNREQCYMDGDHLHGARQVPLRTAADVVLLAEGVERRLTRSTRMNGSSSRSHCITVLTLRRGNPRSGTFRASRASFFDLMGSERFKGANSAHDASKSSKSTLAGWEGIFSNLSLLAITIAVDLSADERKRRGGGGKAKESPTSKVFILTQLMRGSLWGDARMAVVECLSMAPRNGAETYETLKFSASLRRHVNAPKPQPVRALREVERQAAARLSESRAALRRGVKGKFGAIRAAQVRHWGETMEVLAAMRAAPGWTKGGAADREIAAAE